MLSEILKGKIAKLEKCAIALATGQKDASYEDYESARAVLISDINAVKHLPEWLIQCRFGSHYWDFIKRKYSTYRERREFLKEEFSILLIKIDRPVVSPTAISIQSILKNCTSENVHNAWKKCLARKENDPEGAITSARTLIECTCKYILERLKETPDSSGDLPRLYKQVSKAMKLSPGQHDEQLFKQILTGCSMTVDGMASLRNKYGDAHGHGSINAKPNKRHAELAVNLAGAMISFLIATYEEHYRA